MSEESRRRQSDRPHRSGEGRQLTEEERRELIRKKRRTAARKRRRRQVMIMRAVVAGVILLLAVIVIAVAVNAGKKKNQRPKADSGVSSSVSASASGDAKAISAAPAAPVEGQDVLDTAARQAAMYDYDAAIATLQGYSGYESQTAFTDAIDKYTAEKASCVSLDVKTVPHVFFHSLLNDDRGFIAELSSDFVARDNGCWMCSVDEFNTMLQQMYEAGYVLIRLRDMVVETTDENGAVHYTKNTNLMLPPGKKGLVMSEDDLSYYHAYDNQGIASKLVLDENGDVKCVYTNAEGQTSVGDYDMVPLLDSFIDKHPDFSYRGAKAIIALTGYNGVFGYHTDSVYKTLDPERLDANQIVWLQENPDFNYENDVAEATKIANALKADGWEFASHTWGHRNVQNSSAESLAEDNEKWVATVEPIVGKVDTIIFAHGTDIAGVEAYTEENPKYAYFKNAGYNFYCNVDGSTPVWMQIADTYVRSGRINLDGYRLYQTMSGNQNSIAVMNYLGIHDIDAWFDNNRITPVEIP